MFLFPKGQLGKTVMNLSIPWFTKYEASYCLIDHFTYLFLPQGYHED